MKKDLLLAFGLAAVSTTVLTVAVVLHAGRTLPAARQPRRDFLLPQQTPVLSGSAQDLEVLVKRRMVPRAADARASDFLTAALGLDPARQALLEVLVLNHGQQMVRVDLSDLVFEIGDGIRLRAQSLRSLVKKSSQLEALLAAHDPDPAVPLAPGHLRRGLVVVDHDLDLEAVQQARLGSIDLDLRQVATADLDRFMEQPLAPRLLALLEAARPQAAPGGDSRRDSR